MNKILALRQYRLFIKSLPKNNRSNNKHLYQNPPEMQDLKLNHEEFIKDFQIYSNSCKEYNALLERYNIAIPREMKNQIKNVARMVGFELPQKN